METIDKSTERILDQFHKPSGENEEIKHGIPENGENTPADRAGLASRILASAKGAYQRTTEKLSRGRGRPKNCPKCGVPETRCNCNKAPGEALGIPANGSAGVAPADTEIIKKVCRAALKAICGVANSFLAGKIMQKTGDKDFSEKITADCAPTDDELDSFSELGEICLRKYGVGTQYCPEIGLGVIALGIGARYARAFQTVNSIPDRNQEEKAA